MYLTKEKQELMVKNLNYLMRKNNITNPVMQKAIFYRTDKNGALVANLRSGKRKFTINDAICISEFFNIHADVFSSINLELLEQKNIDFNEGLLIKSDEYEKNVFYTYREIGAYSFIQLILYSSILLIMLIGALLSYFNIKIAHYMNLSAIVLIALVFIFLMLKGISEFIYSKKTFLLKESRQYYFINPAKEPIKGYSIFIGVTIFLLAIVFFLIAFNYKKYLIPISLVGFFIIAIHIYSSVLLCLPKQKYMQKINYTLYCFEAIRKYSLILLFLAYVCFIFFVGTKPLYEIIFCLFMIAIIILSEFSNRLIINYYEHYTGKEEK